MKTKSIFILIVAFLCCLTAPAQSNKGTVQRKTVTTKSSPQKLSKAPHSLGTRQKQGNQLNGVVVRKQNSTPVNQLGKGDAPVTPSVQNNKLGINGDNTIHDVAEVMPSFPGGEQGMISWIENNLRYPAEAQNIGIQGRVIVQCIIEKDGSVTVDKIARNIDPQLDNEAVRLIKAMPKWNPGTTNGNVVRTKRMIIIPFFTNR